ncbi:hypothetical protein IW262DRAFT_1452812 [Armillaria fumosa]|nr:hypothetical protein IW262DRAFT_1452812 [Armillaria fumosa]
MTSVMLLIFKRSRVSFEGHLLQYHERALVPSNKLRVNLSDMGVNHCLYVRAGPLSHLENYQRLPIPSGYNRDKRPRTTHLAQLTSLELVRFQIVETVTDTVEPWMACTRLQQMTFGKNIPPD